MNTLFSIIVIGIGATVLMDLWAIVRKSLWGIPTLNYAMVGRWLAHILNGQFHHHSIIDSPQIPGEKIIGWAAHYLTGIAFAVILIALFGLSWLQQPTIGPALFVGISTVVIPFFIMQPAMGAGIAACKTANPHSARLQSLITHAVFGFGLYFSGWTLQLF